MSQVNSREVDHSGLRPLRKAKTVTHAARSEEIAGARIRPFGRHFFQMSRKAYSAVLLLVATALPARPADVDGIWGGRITFKAPGIPEVRRDLTLTLKTAGTSVTGTLAFEWDGQRDSREISDGKIGGNAVTFSFATRMSDIPRMDFTVIRDGDDIKLAVKGKNANTGQEWNFGEGLLTRMN